MNLCANAQSVNGRDGAATRSAWLATALVGFSLGTAGPVASAQQAPPVPMTNSAASFVTWHQGFEHGTDGWYDAATPGPLGWCGEIRGITPASRNSADPTPSAGRSYAAVRIGLCNPFWSGLGVPFGAPYGPGPNQALYSSAWPPAGYVTELDVYLDPAWSEGYSGNFAFAGSSADTLVQYAATVFPTDPDAEPFHTGPHYFVNVEALRGQHALSVMGQTITEAGWYTFRFLFSDDGGSVRADFELAARNGPTLARSDSLPAMELLGPVQVPYLKPVNASEYGSGHVWFFDIALGIDLPIDEHRVRRGR